MITKTEYNRAHKWAERNLKRTRTCFYCGAWGSTQWSNIDHQYRLDPEEWQEVCAKCHHAYDREMNLIPKPIGRLPSVRVKAYAWHAENYA